MGLSITLFLTIELIIDENRGLESDLLLTASNFTSSKATNLPINSSKYRQTTTSKLTNLPGKI